MSDDAIVLITPDDEMIGSIDKISAHKFAMLHRAFSVFIYSAGETEPYLLLQQRQLSKYHCGGLWTNACCSHQRPTESTQLAASRRLQEELGLSLSLCPIGQFHYVAVLDNGFFENELDQVLVGQMDKALPIPFNIEEVMAVQWISLSKLQAWLEQSPEQFTPWFKPALALFLEYLEQS